MAGARGHHGQGSSAFEVELFFDGDCPLCAREVKTLRRMDREHRIRFTDIAASDFSGAGDKDYATLMSRIHARLPDGTWLEGVDVFRHVYAAVGLGRLVAVSRWPGVSAMVEAGYRWFAANRLRVTGRCTPESCATGAR